MRRKIVLAFLAFGVSLMFSGCATMDTINSGLQAVADKIDNATAILQGKNPAYRPKNTDDLKPWEIKKRGDTHYVLDPFFALPGVTSRAEAEKRIVKLLNAIKSKYIAFGRHLTAKSRGCLYVKSSTKGSGINTIFKFSNIQKRCPYEVVLTDHIIGKYTYMQFKAINLKGKWYMVVSNTNAKHVGFLSSILDASRQLSNGLPNYTTPYYNSNISLLINKLSNRAIKENGWEDEFIDINLDSEDERAKEYRDWYVNYMKKAFK